MSTTLLMTPPSDAVDRARALVPPAPRTLEEAGVNLDLAVQLVLKLLHFAGELTGLDISRRPTDAGAQIATSRSSSRR